MHGKDCVMQVDRSAPLPAPPADHRHIARWHQLRWNLIAYFVALTVIPIAFVIAITLVRTSAQSKQQIFNQLRSVAELKEDQITRWLENSSALLRLVASSNNEELATLLAGAAANPQAATANRDLSAAQQAQELFEEFFIYDPQGQILASSNPIQIGKIVANQPYFAASLRESTVQSPYYEIGSGDLTMFITYPVVTASGGAPVGVLGGRLDTSTLGQIMTNRTGLGDTGETYLVSLENNYLLTPSRFESAGYLPSRAYRSVGIDRALKGETGADAYLDYRDPPQRVLGVYRWLPALQVGMLAESDEAAILAPLQQTNTFSISIAIAAALLAAAIGLYKATRIAGPIMTLTAGAEKVAAGDLSQRVDLREQNEFGVLASAFNSMTIQLRQTQQGLEQRVAERTADLEHTVQQLQDALDVHAELRATIRSIDSPIVPIQDGILVMPLVGEIDQERSQQMLNELLTRIADQRASVVVIDVTGVSTIDQPVAQGLVRAADAVQLLGAQAILVGMRPELCEAVVSLGVDLSNLITLADLQSGVTFAMSQYTRRQRPGVRSSLS
jgi:anti-anti-sigma regulatory factor/HAMP domain-containing protein